MEEEARTRARVTKCEDVAGPLPAAVDNNTNNIISPCCCVSSHGFLVSAVAAKG